MGIGARVGRMVALGLSSYFVIGGLIGDVFLISKSTYYLIAGVALLLAVLEREFTEFQAVYWVAIGLGVALGAFEVMSLPLFPPLDVVGPLSFVGAIVGVLVAVPTWFLLFLLVQSIVTSARGKTVDDLRKERMERVDDEYGDQHATEILDEDSK